VLMAMRCRLLRDFGYVTCFQSHSQYGVPSGDRLVSKDYREEAHERYGEVLVGPRSWWWCSVSRTPWSLPWRCWTRSGNGYSSVVIGNGYKFMFGTFSDITYDPEANEAASCKLICKKIAEIVKDPENARKLPPNDCDTRRSLCDGGYLCGVRS
jgi:cyclohexanone monooxygenase